jgi:hypothetical protein
MPWIDNKYIFPRAAAANIQETWPWPSPEESPPPPTTPSINPLLRVKPLLPQPDEGEGGSYPGFRETDPYVYDQSRSPESSPTRTDALKYGGYLLGGPIGGLLGSGIGSAFDVYGADAMGMASTGVNPDISFWSDFINATPLGLFGMGESAATQYGNFLTEATSWPDDVLPRSPEEIAEGPFPGFRFGPESYWPIPDWEPTGAHWGSSEEEIRDEIAKAKAEAEAEAEASFTDFGFGFGSDSSGSTAAGMGDDPSDWGGSFGGGSYGGPSF